MQYTSIIRSPYEKLYDSYESIKCPLKLSITPYPHQLRSAAALLNIEKSRVLEVIYNKKQTKVSTAAAVLSENFGSGKTVIAALYLYAAGTPKLYPTNHAVSSVVNYEIRETITNHSKIIIPSLVVVGNNVYMAWYKMLSTVFGLNVYAADSHSNICKFAIEFASNHINKYDIVLLKNSEIAGTKVCDYETNDNNKTTRSSISAINLITRGYKWSRALYDDFDLLNISAQNNLANAIFSVFISATDRANKYKNNPMEAKLKNNIVDNYVKFGDIVEDKILFAYYNVSHTAESIKKSITIPKTIFKQCVINNEIDNTMGILQAIGGEAHVIAEMINADAMKTAGTAAGFKPDDAITVVDIIKKLLSDQLLIVSRNNRIIEVTSKLLKIQPGNEEILSDAYIANIRSSINKGITPNIPYWSYDLVNMIKEIHYEAVEERNKAQAALDRVKSNIREQQCQLCKLEVEGKSVIMRCCGVVLDEDCNNYGNKNNKCCNCKKQIMPTDIIPVDSESLLQNLSTVDLSNIKLEGDTAQVVSPKTKLLLDIIKGVEILPREGLTISNDYLFIDKLLEGDEIIPTKRPLKMVVYANHAETLENIRDVLYDNKIDFYELGGNHDVMDATIAEFEKCGTVLLINSSKNAGGINLQFANVQVFLHEIIDKKTNAQAHGRTIRIGRVDSVTIYKILYGNEHTKK